MVSLQAAAGLRSLHGAARGTWPARANAAFCQAGGASARFCLVTRGDIRWTLFLLEQR